MYLGSSLQRTRRIATPRKLAIHTTRSIPAKILKKTVTPMRVKKMNFLPRPRTSRSPKRGAAPIPRPRTPALRTGAITQTRTPRRSRAVVSLSGMPVNKVAVSATPRLTRPRTSAVRKVCKQNSKYRTTILCAKKSINKTTGNKTTLATLLPTAAPLQRVRQRTRKSTPKKRTSTNACSFSYNYKLVKRKLDIISNVNATPAMVKQAKPAQHIEVLPKMIKNPINVDSVTTRSNTESQLDEIKRNTLLCHRRYAKLPDKEIVMFWLCSCPNIQDISTQYLHDYRTEWIELLEINI